MSEKCPVCKAECENGAIACSVCGFAYKPKIDMTWPIPEDAKNWIETVVKPYRMQWEAKQREAVLLSQLEESKKREADLLSQLEESKKREADLLSQLEETKKQETNIPTPYTNLPPPDITIW